MERVDRELGSHREAVFCSGRCVVCAQRRLRSSERSGEHQEWSGEALDIHETDLGKGSKGHVLWTFAEIHHFPSSFMQYSMLK